MILKGIGLGFWASLKLVWALFYIIFFEGLFLLAEPGVRHERHLHARAPRLVYDTATRAFDYPTEVGRKEVHSGKTRNNFAVMLKSTR